MGLYAMINLEDLEEESSTLLDELFPELEAEYDAYMDEASTIEEETQTEYDGEPLSWDDLSQPTIPDLNADPAAEAFRNAFMSTINQLTPIRTGYLLSSIHCEIHGSIIECFADAEYAEYVEYGTYKMEAQPYFEPAIQAGVDAAYEVMNNILQQWMEQVSKAIMMTVQEGLSSIDGGGPSVIGFIFGLVLAMLVAFMIEMILGPLFDALSIRLDGCLEAAFDIIIT